MSFPLAVFTGRVLEYPAGRPSAIAKRAVNSALVLSERGLEGDEQAEPGIHGGPDRALCHYPREHYAHWARKFPARANRFAAASFGENLSTVGLTEENVFIGDIFCWGDALIQVTQPRSPCFKVNFHFAIEDLSLQMQNAARVGWLYRVIAGGRVSPEAPLELASRVSDVTVLDAAAIAWHLPFDDAQYRRLLGAAGLSTSWTRTLQKRRLSGEIEDFSRRLWGSARP
ncbi:6-N-hydroxylaminopurine resistance protein [Paraburkholderia silviterrae]|uniref:6-N-hydroxylaminopurine resistance protein n=2 Tax=Paraburkholderia silviterrae TaxID=2528715 RepID=A0A4R5MA00_9BURK|nr:6-N-hydroxylaminopurine resistance protein [Paraburkholderia silviterrae]